MMRESPAGYGAMTIALDEHLQPPGLLVLRGKPEALAGWQAELAREFLPDTTVLAIADGAPGLPPPLDKPARPEPGNAWLCPGGNCPLALRDLFHFARTFQGR